MQRNLENKNKSGSKFNEYFTKLKKPIAGVALVGAVFGGGVVAADKYLSSGEYHNQEIAERPDELAEAARAVATMYEACSIDSQALRELEPEAIAAEARDSSSRSTLQIAVNFRISPKGEEAMKRYTDKLTWYNPDLVGSLVVPTASGVASFPVSGPEIPSQQEPTLQPDGNLTLTSELYPLTTHPEGTKIAVALRQQVVDNDQQNFYVTEGSMPCGYLVLKGGHWEAQPVDDDTPTIKEEVRPAQHN